MDMKEFEKRLLVRGGDLSRWPDAEVEAARRLLEADAGSRALLAEVVAYDDALRADTTAPLDARLVGRIMASTRAPATDRGLSSAWRRMISAGALAALLVGFVGFKSGYDNGLGTAQEIDLAELVVGDMESLEDLP